ncbi:putative ubiquitination network signaling protein acrB [Colletotrichum siamense]|uniref:Ubiquitination network signaling protein acrB n=1 Tax=Colletotrichum siamense TaxID=690259 RepID=A0A9P5K667_COLSI|nr:putative ubiquitination network signaling protein acrB [Colletotrichum siamense]KAF4859581.1 putative ubiquitination network signaling protein acrB [Colletotrichum siamense]
MPRASSSAKRQQGAAANQRDTRHENGLVGPAKRVSNKKSQPNLDPNPSASASASASTSTSASNSRLPPDQNAAASALPSPLPNGSSNGHLKNPAPGATIDTMPPDQRNGDASARRGSLGGCSETSSSESLASNMGNGAVDTNHRQIDVNATKNADVHRDPGGPIEFAATVLRALPLYDTLAILILLMQVPPVALSGIYMVFTFLTFVPPVTTSSGMNINLAEIFDYNSTMPSLVTVLCMDVFILLVWLFLWPPMQLAILDFAKPVIAATLGGGSNTREGASRSVTSCFLLVIGSHLLRGSRFHWSRATKFLPANWRFSPDSDDPLESFTRGFDKRGPHGWIKSILAIHILTQGIVRYIREWYLRREKGSASAHSITDPEAGKSYATDTATENGFATPDSDATFQQNAAVSSTKKKRKQSTQVRLQQPLWAALASTKIVMVKEYELSHATSESAGSNATDIHNLGNAPFDSQAEQIWISYIGHDEVCFNTSHFPDSPTAGNGHLARPAGVDTSKPFYVRVNNAFWQPTRIYRIQDEAQDEHLGHHRWCGDIYGLRPLSKYVCEFVDTHTNRVIFSTSIRTSFAPNKDQEGSVNPPVSTPQSLRPDSPATTLKSTIKANNDRLAEEKSRLKALRKEWKSKTTSLKKENDKLDNMIQTAGSNDDKHRQKIIQQETTKAQSEKETAQLDAELKAFEKAPDGLYERKRQTEKEWTAEKAVFDTASKEFKDYKAGIAKTVKVKEDEQAAMQTKRNKIAARIAKVDNELGRITDANNRGLDEAERRRQARAAWQADSSKIENNFLGSIETLRSANMNKQNDVNALLAGLQQIHEYVNNATAATMPFDLVERQPAQLPSTLYNPAAPSWTPSPAGASQFTVPAASMWPTAATTAPGSTLPLPATTASAVWGFPPAHQSTVSLKARGRSSSMLSDVSGFTQSSDGDEFLSLNNTPAHGHTVHRTPVSFAFTRRQRSDGAGSGGSSIHSGSGSGSLRDPASPI